MYFTFVMIFTISESKPFQQINKKFSSHFKMYVYVTQTYNNFY